MKRVLLLLPALIFAASAASAADAPRGNTQFESFSQVKKILLNQVFNDHRTTIYCGASFTPDKQVILPKGFIAAKSPKRANRIEWEHILPAENFGRAFTEWREGAPECVKGNGKPYKGRACANRASAEYRQMQADMYNLYPAIGSVNAARQNYDYTQFAKGTPNTFGTCPMKIEDRKAEPPDAVKGLVARTYKYMEWAYPKYRMSNQTRQLMNAWDKTFPATAWECERASRIAAIQGNVNPFTQAACRKPAK